MTARSGFSVFSLATAIAAIACTADAPPLPVAGGEPWSGTITTEGDITTVINESGSVWQGTAVLVEEASIGVEFGRDPYMFGRVTSVAMSDDRIYVTDRQVPALRVYDWSGRYLRDIGRQGQGPGEFQSAASVGIDGAGRVWLDDMAGSRVLVFSPDGEPLATLRKRPPYVAGSTPMVVTADGRGFVLGIERETETAPGRNGMIGYGFDGSVGGLVAFPDFADPPVLEAEASGRIGYVDVPLFPRGVAVLTAAPAMLSGYPEFYRFRLERLGGGTMIVERGDARIPVSAEEAAAVERAANRFLEGYDPSWKWPDAPLPGIKPAYSALIAAATGEVWVVRSGVSTEVPDCDEEQFEATGEPHCWREQRIADVFGADGRYLGDVVLPGDLVITNYALRPFIRGNDVVGVVEDDEGTIRVKRYRLILPETR